MSTDNAKTLACYRPYVPDFTAYNKVPDSAVIPQGLYPTPGGIPIETPDTYEGQLQYRHEVIYFRHYLWPTIKEELTQVFSHVHIPRGRVVRSAEMPNVAPQLQDWIYAAAWTFNPFLANICVNPKGEYVTMRSITPGDQLIIYRGTDSKFTLRGVTGVQYTS
jgi:hypothetical protein